MSIRTQSKVYRLRAAVCDQRAGQVTDPALKRDWQELAIEWHVLANVTAKENCEVDQLDIEMK